MVKFLIVFRCKECNTPQFRSVDTKEHKEKEELKCLRCGFTFLGFTDMED